MRKKKKSYNPFTMWGSWVGAFVGLSLIIISGIINTFFKSINIEFLNNFLNVIVYPIDKLFPNVTNIFPFALFTMIVGFLIGWGIHSIFRRFT